MSAPGPSRRKHTRNMDLPRHRRFVRLDHHSLDAQISDLVGRLDTLLRQRQEDSDVPKPLLQQQISSHRDRLRDLERLRFGALI